MPAIFDKNTNAIYQGEDAFQFVQDAIVTSMNDTRRRGDQPSIQMDSRFDEKFVPIKPPEDVDPKDLHMMDPDPRHLTDNTQTVESKDVINSIFDTDPIIQK